MASDPRPCGGDAFRQAGMLSVWDPPTCEYCRKSETHGGKCAGENRWYFMLCMLPLLGDWDGCDDLDDHCRAPRP